MTTRALLAFVGGAIGALLRVLILAIPLWPDSPVGAAIGLTGVNITGALLLGWLLAAIPPVTARAQAIVALLGTGILGGFTSYSALILLALAPGGALPLGALLGVATLLFGIVAAWLGTLIGRLTGNSGEARSAI